jgi:hypothetical protein
VLEIGVGLGPMLSFYSEQAEVVFWLDPLERRYRWRDSGRQSRAWANPLKLDASKYLDTSNNRVLAG